MGLLFIDDGVFREVSLADHILIGCVTARPERTEIMVTTGPVEGVAINVRAPRARSASQDDDSNEVLEKHEYRLAALSGIPGPLGWSVAYMPIID